MRVPTIEEIRGLAREEINRELGEKGSSGLGGRIREGVREEVQRQVHNEGFVRRVTSSLVSKGVLFTPFGIREICKDEISKSMSGFTPIIRSEVLSVLVNNTQIGSLLTEHKEKVNQMLQDYGRELHRSKESLLRQSEGEIQVLSSRYKKDFDEYTSRTVKEAVRLGPESRVITQMEENIRSRLGSSINMKLIVGITLSLFTGMVGGILGNTICKGPLSKTRN